MGTQGNIAAGTGGVGLEVTKIAGAAHVNCPGGIGRQGENAAIGAVDATPGMPVVFEEAFIVADIKHAAVVLQDGPVLGAGAVFAAVVIPDDGLPLFRMPSLRLCNTPYRRQYKQAACYGNLEK